MAQLDPLTGQTVPLLPIPADEEQATVEPELTPLERRRGRRRAEEAEAELAAERRQGDRRKRTPGLPALLGAILADDEEQPPES
jgi:hypothetical protein